MMTNSKSYNPDFLIHPGETLKENLDFLSVGQNELSMKTGISKKHINNIIKGNASISPKTAIKLEKTLGIKASFWNNLEKNYQADLARLEQEKEIKKEISKNLENFRETYKELKKKGIIKESYSWRKCNFKKILLILQKFFGVASLHYVYNTKQCAFRKYKSKNVNQYTVAAWLMIGELKARKVETKLYNEKKLKNLLKDLKTLSQIDYKKYLPMMEKKLADCGIVLVCAPYLKNTSAQGATKWISKDKAFIILKSDNQFEDRFWFNLFHEIGHILEHGKSKTYINIEDDKEAKEEKEADNFAQKKLLPKFNVNEVKDKSDILQIAKTYQVSASIIAGRIAHEHGHTSKICSSLKGFINKIDYINVF